MTSEDRELDLWKQEWKAEAATTLPQLRKRIGLQTARMIASNLVGIGLSVVVGLVYAVRVVLQQPAPRTIVWGSGVLLCWLTAFIFTVWNQIGIWRVETESTRAYAELSYKRALTKVRRTRFLLVLVSFGVAFGFVDLLWEDWPLSGIQPAMFITRHARVAVVLLGLWFINWYGRRKARQLEEARLFMEEVEG